MKRLILLVILLAPLHAFAAPCHEENGMTLKYRIESNSGYEIHLDFDEARHGENPPDMKQTPNKNYTEAFGCATHMFSGYETRATLSAHGNEGVFDLAYIYIDQPFIGDGHFSYNAYTVKSPECNYRLCNRSWDRDMIFDEYHYDCQYTGAMKYHMMLMIVCE